MVNLQKRLDLLSGQDIGFDWLRLLLLLRLYVRILYLIMHWIFGNWDKILKVKFQLTLANLFTLIFFRLIEIVLALLNDFHGVG